MEFTNYIPSLDNFINLCSSDVFSKKEITLQSQSAILLVTIKLIV
jgi:hypothetical protein